MGEADPAIFDRDDVGAERRLQAAIHGAVDGLRDELDPRMGKGRHDGESVLGLGRQFRQLVDEEGHQLVGQREIDPSLEAGRLAPEGASEFERKERVAARHGMDPRECRASKRDAEPRLEELPEGSKVEGPDRKSRQWLAGKRAIEAERQAGRLLDPAPKQNPDRFVAQATDGEGEGKSGGRVQPLDVIDSDEDRTGPGQAPERVAERDRDGVVVRRSLLRLVAQERNPQRALLWGGEGGEGTFLGRLEQVADPRVGERGLRIGWSSREHPPGLLSCLLDAGEPEGRHAHSGFALDDHDLGTRENPGEECVDLREFGVSAENDLSHGSPILEHRRRHRSRWGPVLLAIGGGGGPSCGQPEALARPTRRPPGPRRATGETDPRRSHEREGDERAPPDRKTPGLPRVAGRGPDGTGVGCSVPRHSLAGRASERMPTGRPEPRGSPGGRQMIICLKCGQQADPGETFCPRCGAFLEWAGAPATPSEAAPLVTPTASTSRPASNEPEFAGARVVATLSASSVQVEPGGQASLKVEVLNRGRTVDQLSLEVRGPAAGWASVDPARLNLMPDTSGVATVRFHPPRTSAVQAGGHQVDVAVTSREHPDASVVNSVVVEVMPFIALETSLAPSVLRGAAATATRLQVSNSGNVPVDLSLGGDDPEMAFEFRINTPTLRLDPGATADALVVVKPREPIQSGPDRTRPFRVLATASDGSRRTLDGTFIQAAVPAPPPAEPQVIGPPVVATLGASSVRVEPGGQASVTVEVLNRGRTADRVSLEVRGPTEAWASVEPARLNVAPDTSAVATVSFSPPRTPAMRPGRYPVDVAVTSREHPDASVVSSVVVEVMPFVELETGLAPSVLRGGREATSKLQVSNRGNAPADLSFGGDDPEAAFQFRVSPSKLRLNPGAAGKATVVVKARRDNRSRTDMTRPFRVLASASDGSRHAADGMFIQPAPRGRRRWPWAFALLGLLGVIAFFVANLNPPGPQPFPPASIVPAASVPVASVPVASVPVGPDIGGRYYLDPGSSRIIVITPVGENRYTIEEQLPASWPFTGTLEWVNGDRFEGPATFASGTTFRVEVERKPDGRLTTLFDYISDDQGNPTNRTDPHELVPVS